MANTFNKDFQRALGSKLALQSSQAGRYDAQAGLDTERTRLLEPDTRSAIDLRGAQAGFERERTGLLGREVESQANLRDQQAREARIGTNIGLGKGLLELNRDRFGKADFDYERGGAGGFPTMTDDSAYAVGGDRNVFGDRIRREGNTYSSYAEGGIVGEPDTMSFAAGGLVPGGADSGFLADYELYRKAAKNAGVTELPPQEAIPRMAQLRADKREKVFKLIEGGGTTPTQNLANGGEIDGPGTGKSDSIPAVVDGVGAAAVSDGEFLIPKHVVDYFGVKMLDGLVEKARMASKVNKNKANGYAQGGAVKKPVRGYADGGPVTKGLRPDERGIRPISPSQDEYVGRWVDMKARPLVKGVLSAERIAANKRAGFVPVSFEEKAAMKFPTRATIDGESFGTYGDAFARLQETRGQAPFGVVPMDADSGPKLTKKEIASDKLGKKSKAAWDKAQAAKK